MPKRSMFYGFDAKSYRILGLGLELGLLIGGMTWLGHFLDSRWGWTPWLTLSGAVLATVGGSYTIYKTMAMKDRRKWNAKVSQRAPLPPSMKPRK